MTEPLVGALQLLYLETAAPGADLLGEPFDSAKLVAQLFRPALTVISGDGQYCLTRNFVRAFLAKCLLERLDQRNEDFGLNFAALQVANLGG